VQATSACREKKKRKKREAKAKRAKGFNKKGRNQKKKKFPQARKKYHSFKFVYYHKGKNTVFYKNLNSSVIFGT